MSEQWLDLQRRFAAGLWTGQWDAIAGWVEGPGLAIHRATVLHTLTEALADIHPVTRQVVGDDFFRQTAERWLAETPPTSATLVEYGEGFSRFLAGYAPAAEVPYLSALARLEWCRHAALHAAEAVPLRPEALGGLTADQIDGLRLALHPSARIIRADWPVLDLWRAHQPPETGGPDGLDGPDGLAGLGPFLPRRQDILVIRPMTQVEMAELPPGGAVFLDHLPVGLAAAIAAASDAQTPFDAAPLLATALSGGWFGEDWSIGPEKELSR